MWKPHLLPEKPLYVALADAISRDVASGCLQRGARLPTHRELAEVLGVTVGTVTRGYALAERRGLVTGVTGKGTFVTPDAATDSSLLEPKTAGNRQIEMGLVTLDNSPGPDVSKVLRSVAASPLAQRLLQYADPAGIPAHREAGALWLRRLGFAPHPEDVLVCAGGQHALTCSLLALVGPGEALITEPLTYPGMKTLARSLGVRLVAAPADNEGVLPAELENVCRREGAKAVYLMPSVNNPTTRCMSEQRRMAVAAVAERLGLWLLEDDAYACLREDRGSSLALYAPQHTVSICSLSKILGGGVRTAFVYAPCAVRGAMLRAVQNTVWMAPPLLVELAVRWLQSGEADAVIQARQRAYRSRWQTAVDCLQGHEFEGFSGGYFIWLHLPAPWSGLAFEARAREAGVAVFASERFKVAHEPAPGAVRLSLSGPGSGEELRQGLEILRSLLLQDAAVDFPIM